MLASLGMSHPPSRATSRVLKKWAPRRCDLGHAGSRSHALLTTNSEGVSSRSRALIALACSRVRACGSGSARRQPLDLARDLLRRGAGHARSLGRARATFVSCARLLTTLSCKSSASGSLLYTTLIRSGLGIACASYAARYMDTTRKAN